MLHLRSVRVRILRGRGIRDRWGGGAFVPERSRGRGGCVAALSPTDLPGVVDADRLAVASEARTSRAERRVLPVLVVDRAEALIRTHVRP